MGADQMRFSAIMTAVLLSWQSPALAADGGAQPVQQGPLRPGKSAGVQAAQQTRAGLALIGAGAIIAIVAVTTTGNSSNNQPNAQSAPVTTP